VAVEGLVEVAATTRDTLRQANGVAVGAAVGGGKGCCAYSESVGLIAVLLGKEQGRAESDTCPNSAEKSTEGGVMASRVLGSGPWMTLTAASD
jgi:hypothetical protein